MITGSTLGSEIYSLEAVAGQIKRFDTDIDLLRNFRSRERWELFESKTQSVNRGSWMPGICFSLDHFEAFPTLDLITFVSIRYLLISLGSPSRLHLERRGDVPTFFSDTLNVAKVTSWKTSSSNRSVFAIEESSLFRLLNAGEGQLTRLKIYKANYSANKHLSCPSMS